MEQASPHVASSKHPITLTRASVVMVLFMAVIWWHALVGADRDFDAAVEIGLWVAASALKLLVLFVVFITLARAYSVVAGRARMAVLAFVLWSVALTVVVTGLTFGREQLADVIRNPAVKYYTLETYPDELASEIGREDWLPRWQSGQIMWLEIGLALLICLVHTLFAWIAGKTRYLAVFGAVVIMLIIMALHVGLFNLVINDYDVFHGDIFSAALLGDLILAFLATDPYVEISSLIYLAVFVSSCVIIRLGQQTVTPPA